VTVKMKNIVIFVNDLARAKSFYCNLMQLQLAGETQMLLEFFPDSATTLGVSLALNEEARKLVGRHTGITLRVEEIEKLCERLNIAGARFVEPLESSPWGRMAVIADPDGNQLALVDR
jgi:lactoylglutathione lyase